MKTDIDKLDHLTSRRLARLGQARVDTSSLEQRLEAAIWQQRQRRRFAAWRTPQAWSGVAAAVIVAIAVAFAVVQGTGTPVVAAPVAIAQAHRQLVSGEVPVVPVSDLAEANRYLQTQWSDAPPLPNVSAATVTACCQHKLLNRKVACVLLDYRGEQVTMMVGRSRDLVCAAKHEDMVRDGKHYAVHESDGLRMVMIESEGRWVCLMSHASIDALMDLADSLRI